MPSVFLSYTSEDKAFARHIAHALSAHAITVWVDQYEILPGDALRAKIVEGIRRSEYFIVLLSRASLRSNWVTRELEVALEHNAEAARRRIIPVRIEDVDLPPRLADFRYVDLSRDFESGIAEIVRTITRHDAEGARPLDEVVNVDALVRNTEETEREFKGSGYGITTTLSILTIVVTLATAVPAFYQAFLQRSKVYYAIAEERLALPAHIDRNRVSALFVQHGIASGYARVQIVNRGTTAAKSVAASVEVPGRIADFNTVPADQPRPVWVGIERDANLQRFPGSVRLRLTDLVPEKVVVANISYHQTGDSRQSPRVDVVSDGELATRVARVEDAPQLTFWSYFEVPAIVLGVGALVTIVAGLIAVVRRNREIADALLLLAKELNPWISYLVRFFRV